MIVAKMSNNGLLLGLTEENVKRLKANEPIINNHTGQDIYIMYGKTEFDIVNGLKKAGLINESTQKSFYGMVKDGEGNDL